MSKSTVSEWSKRERDGIQRYLDAIKAAQRQRNASETQVYEHAYDLEHSKEWGSLKIKPEGGFANWLAGAVGVNAKSYSRYASARDVLGRERCLALLARGAQEIIRLTTNAIQACELADRVINSVKMIVADKSLVPSQSLISREINKFRKEMGIEAVQRPKKPDISGVADELRRLLLDVEAISSEEAVRRLIRTRMTAIGLTPHTLAA